MMDLGNSGKPITITKDNIFDFFVQAGIVLREQDQRSLSSAEIIRLSAIKVKELRSRYTHTRQVRKRLERFIKDLLKVKNPEIFQMESWAGSAAEKIRKDIDSEILRTLKQGSKSYESSATATAAIKVRPDITFGMKIQPIPFTKILASGS